MLHSAPRSGPDPARPRRLPPAALTGEAPQGRPHPYSSGCGLSPSRSRRSSPGSPWRQLNWVHRLERRQRNPELWHSRLRPTSVRRKPTENGVPVRLALGGSESGRETSRGAILVPPARLAGAGEARWARPGRGPAGGAGPGEGGQEWGVEGRERPSEDGLRIAGPQLSRLCRCKEKAPS